MSVSLLWIKSSQYVTNIFPTFTFEPIDSHCNCITEHTTSFLQSEGCVWIIFCGNWQHVVAQRHYTIEAVTNPENTTKIKTYARHFTQSNYHSAVSSHYNYTFCPAAERLDLYHKQTDSSHRLKHQYRHDYISKSTDHSSLQTTELIQHLHERLSWQSWWQIHVDNTFHRINLKSEHFIKVSPMRSINTSIYTPQERKTCNINSFS